MDEEKDILSRVLKEREKNFSMTVDDHVWEKIVSDLPARNKMRVKRLWIISSVAASLLLMLFLGRQFILEDETLTKARQLAKKEITDKSEAIPKENWVADNRQQDKTEDFREKKQEKTVTTEKNRVVKGTLTDKEYFIELEERELSPETEVQKGPLAESVSGKETEERKILEEKFAKAGQEIPDLWKQPDKSKRAQRKISLALAVGNQTSSFSPSMSLSELRSSTYAVPAKQTLDGNQSSNNALVLSDMFSKATTLGIDNTQENIPATTEIDYKMPVTASVLVRKYLGDSKWALETGLSYTHLASTERLSHDASGFSKDIDLDYLGVPLKVAYDIYQTDRLSLYVTAGGQVEKLVNGKETNFFSENNERTRNDLDISELQWSLMGNVGLNYRLIQHFGLFVEPGVQYFFNDRSGVQTIRKDKPFNFGIQAGFRLIY